MPCVSGTMYQVTCSVYATVHVYTEQVTFYEVPENHGHVYLAYDGASIPCSRLRYWSIVALGSPRQLQADQLYMAVYFWYLVKIDLSSVRYCTKSFFTRFQKQAAMYNWSPCTVDWAQKVGCC